MKTKTTSMTTTAAFNHFTKHHFTNAVVYDKRVRESYDSLVRKGLLKVSAANRLYTHYWLTEQGWDKANREGRTQQRFHEGVAK